MASMKKKISDLCRRYTAFEGVNGDKLKCKFCDYVFKFDSAQNAAKIKNHIKGKSHIENESKGSKLQSNSRMFFTF